jgi:hypothetical protein
MTSTGGVATAELSSAALAGDGAGSGDISLDITHCEGFKYLRLEEMVEAVEAVVFGGII